MYTLFQTLIARLENEERGQTMAEYAVVLAVITLVVIGAITTLSGQISDKLGDIGSVLSGAGV